MAYKKESWQEGLTRKQVSEAKARGRRWKKATKQTKKPNKK